jgi:probable selenium-dependent hydroxylase accessory protein YqeC
MTPSYTADANCFGANEFTKRMDIVTALNAREGLVCFVGAGGKKTTMYTLGARLDQAVLTATVRIPIFDPHVEQVFVTDDPVVALSTVDAWPVGVVPCRDGENRYQGYDPTTVDPIAEDSRARTVLLKADGARTRWLKAPNEHEPQLPESAATVVPIASVRVVGKPLSTDHVHRPERVAELTGRAIGDTLTAEDVATVLGSELGGLKNIPSDAVAIPLVNMVDNASLEADGREIAREILDRADVPRVVLAQMTDDEPLVAVIE